MAISQLARRESLQQHTAQLWACHKGQWTLGWQEMEAVGDGGSLSKSPLKLTPKIPHKKLLF
jgi:hypothetical protein